MINYEINTPKSLSSCHLMSKVRRACTGKSSAGDETPEIPRAERVVSPKDLPRRKPPLLHLMLHPSKTLDRLHSVLTFSFAVSPPNFIQILIKVMYRLVQN